ncbi:MAG TPA: hypothetical protein VM370_05155 [Candidatus Thermoplasmatota archaeon]|nr:hypothetical protein [Candidatus Thermoplasmatota archaeon]
METEKKDPRMIPREKDDDALSPLGRGADPGTSVEGGPIQASGPGGLHGAQTPRAKGGPEGMLHRENEDAVQSARD